MDKIGLIKAIVNEDLVVVEIGSDALVNLGDRLTIFRRISNDQLRHATGLEHVDIPKGEIELTSKQADNIYLGERFRHPSNEFRMSPTPFGSSILGLLLESKEPLPGKWSANFNEAENLRIEADRLVRIGDFVGKA